VREYGKPKKSRAERQMINRKGFREAGRYRGGRGESREREREKERKAQKF